MPYDESTGRVHAPVGLVSVALALKEPLTDTATLCRSGKINPYSLISPRYRNVAPGLPPEAYKNATYKNINQDVPPSKKSLLAIFDISQKTPTEYPCVSEYTFTANAHVQYEARNWGYWVPYVQRMQDIFALGYLPWLRFYPGDDAGETAANKSWCRLDQFDGYLHTKEPSPIMSNVHLEYGEQPAYTPVISNGAFRTANILNLTDGKNNPGGVVSVAAVLTNGTAENKKLRYGVTYFTRNTASDKFIYAGSAISTQNVGQIAGSTGGEVDGGEILQKVGLYGRISGVYEAMIVPWVIEVKNETDVVSVITSGDDKGKLSLPAGVKIFSMKFAPGYEAVARSIVHDRYIYPQTVQGRLAVTVHHVSGKQWYVGATLLNPYGNYPLQALLFKLNVRHTGSGSPLNINSFVAGTSGTGTMSINGVGSTGIILNAPDYDYNSRLAGVKLYFELPSESDSVSGFEMTYLSHDENHGNPPINIEVRISNYDILQPPTGDYGHLDA